MRLAFVASLGILMSGCSASVAGGPAAGYLYADLTYPLVPVEIGPASSYPKVGYTGHCRSYFGLVSMGDCSIQSALRKADISKIHHIDAISKNILGIYAEVSYKVYGE